MAVSLSLDLQIALIAVFIQVLLTFWAAVSMAQARVQAVQSRAVGLRQIAIDSTAYPEGARQRANNLSNQFEFPILLYAAVALAAAFGASSIPFALACLAFALARIWHRMIHVGSNNVVMRFKVFLGGIVCLFAAWVFLALGLFGLM
jgi:hypothetical protein